MDKRLKDLRALTQMALDVEMMKLQRIVSAEPAKAGEIKTLDATAAIRASQLAETGGDDMALYAGADMRWAIWKQQKKAALNVQRAALLAKRDVQRSATQKAFGKNAAVRQLMERADEAAQVKSRRV